MYFGTLLISGWNDVEFRIQFHIPKNSDVHIVILNMTLSRLKCKSTNL